jgi:hypothetical protein
MIVNLNLYLQIQKSDISTVYSPIKYAVKGVNVEGLSIK